MISRKGFRRAGFAAAAVVLALSLGGCSDSGSESGVYTYRSTYGGKLTNFSPTDYTDATAGMVIDYTSSSLYERYINEDKKSADFHPVMAASYPVDVTEKYSGQEAYGIDENTKSQRAWQITLREDLAWENGDPITADDYIYSLKQYIDPELKSYRASNYIYGSIALAGAEDYYAGRNTDYSKVGIIKDDDHTLTFIFASDISCNTLMYNFNITLVNEKLYESLKTDTDGLIKSSYGTDISKYLSYGPYRIRTYEEGKELIFERNPGWFGYQDDFYRDKYQTTNIQLSVVNGYSTKKSLFFQGKLDELGLDSDAAAEYGTSDYSLYNDSSTTYYFSLNADFNSLKARESKGVNKTILSYVDFRKAFSLALNRREYTAKFTAVCEPAFGLLNDMYICNLDTMQTYRSLPEARQTLCEVYNTDNYSNLSGYDVEYARSCLVQAYEQCLKDGNISPDDQIVLEYTVSSITGSQKQLDFLSDSLNEIAAGTPLEGRIKIELRVSQDRYSDLKAGKVDFTMSGWSGGVTDAYSMMQCYTEEGTMTEHGYSPDTPLTIEIEGEQVTKGIYDWYLALTAGDYSGAAPEIRNTILTAMEKAILTNYQVIPLLSERSLTLCSQRMHYYTDEPVDSMIARGGIAQITYTMDDKEWDEYCRSKHYHLVY